MLFQLPAGLAREVAQGLERTCLVGGPDNMPWPAELTIANGQLSLHRGAVDESGYVVAPWDLGEQGHLMVGSATLMERPAPYDLLVELARGKVNQVRTQAADWEAGGLRLDAALSDLIQRAALTFGQAVCHTNVEETRRHARSALLLASEAANRLVEAY